MIEKINIGWIGLGNIGTPMVKNLVNAGYNVTVYNRNAAKSAAFSETMKVGVASTPAELVATSDFIISMISDDAAVKEVYQGVNGILSVAGNKELIAIDMSTVSPESTKEIAALCAKQGISYLDAPVSGSIKPAEEGQLVIMVGGEEAAYEKAKPIFDILGKSSTYLGDSGKGNVAKLAINLLLGIVTQGLSEAVVFAEKNNVPAADLLPLINAGALANGVIKMKTENIINNNYKPAFALKLLVKDIRLAKDYGMDTPIGEALYDTIKDAADNGLAEEDMISVLKYLSAK
jgi:3-hydroxyisobutyrate dehydrogenase